MLFFRILRAKFKPARNSTEGKRPLLICCKGSRYGRCLMNTYIYIITTFVVCLFVFVVMLYLLLLFPLQGTSPGRVHPRSAVHPLRYSSFRGI